MDAITTLVNNPQSLAVFLFLVGVGLIALAIEAFLPDNHHVRMSGEDE